MAQVLPFSIAFRLPYGIFVNLSVYTPAPCEQEDFLCDGSTASCLPTGGHSCSERDNGILSYPNQPESILRNREVVL